MKFKTNNKCSLLAAALFSLACFFYTSAAFSETDNVRVISLGGEITEMVILLGMEKNIVAVDTTSTWPELVTKLPQVGYLRALSAEGVLSMSPTIVVANEEAGPHSVIRQIKSSGVEYHTIHQARDFQGIADNVRQLGKILSHEKQANLIAGSIEKDAAEFSEKIRKNIQRDNKQPAILFLLSAGSGTPMVSGSGTAADAMIKLVGGRNVITSYKGYRAVSADAILARQPDVILMTTRTLKILGGIENVLNIPGLSNTPAAKNRRIISLDDMYLLGFGPRTVAAATELSSLIK